MNDDTNQTAHDQGGDARGGGGCLRMVGCGCLVLFILALAGGIYLAMNWQTLTRNASAAMVEFTAETTMETFAVPPAEQAEVMAELEVFTTGIRDGTLPAMEASSTLLGQLAESSIAPALGYYMFVDRYIDNGGLADGERDAARMQTQRFLRGSIEEVIPQATIDSVIDRLMKKKPDGTPADEQTLRDDIQPDEIREIVKDMRLAADDAGVPDEPYEVDLSAVVAAELQKVTEAQGPTSGN